QEKRRIGFSVWSSGAVVTVAVGLDAVIVDGNLDSHGPLTGVFLHDLGCQSRNASDDENEFGEQWRESEIVKHSGQCSVHVYRERFDQLARHRLHRGNEL